MSPSPSASTVADKYSADARCASVADVYSADAYYDSAADDYSADARCASVADEYCAGKYSADAYCDSSTAGCPQSGWWSGVCVVEEQLPMDLIENCREHFWLIKQELDAELDSKFTTSLSESISPYHCITLIVSPCSCRSVACMRCGILGHKSKLAAACMH